MGGGVGDVTSGQIQGMPQGMTQGTTQDTTIRACPDRAEDMMADH